MEDKWKTSVNSCGPRHPEWETSVGDKLPKAPRVGGKCARQVGDKWETSGRQVGDKCKVMRPKAQGTQSVRQVGDKCKLMRPKTTRVGDKCGRQV